MAMKRLFFPLLILLSITVTACGPSEEDLLAKGRALMATEDYSEAVRTFNELLEKFPNNYDAMNAKGVALLRLGQINESIEVLVLQSMLIRLITEPSLIEGMPIECWVKIMRLCWIMTMSRRFLQIRLMPIRIEAQFF